MKQKILSLMTALTLVVSLIVPVSVSAQGMGTITVSGASDLAGSTVELEVRIDDNPGILGATFTLEYDEGLTLLEATKGEAFEDLAMTLPGQLTSPCKFPFSGETLADEDIKDGVIMTLKFKIADDVLPETELNVNLSYEDGDIIGNDLKALTPSVQNGCVKVLDFIYGDLNSDGKVNTTDAIMICRQVAGGYEQTIREEAADLDLNDRISSLDIILLKRFIAGGYGITFPYNDSTEPDTPETDTPESDNSVKFLVSDIEKDGDGNPKVNRSQIEVREKGTTIRTTYKFSSDCEFYVNGINIDMDSDISRYLTCKRNTVSLIDTPDPTTGEVDGRYDKMMLDCYAVGQVTNVNTSGNNVKIVTDNGFSIEWSVTDLARDVRIIKDGESIDYTEINEDDIVLVSYENQYNNIFGDSIDIICSDWVEILVSSNTVTGAVTAKSTVWDREYVIIDGKEYKFNDGSTVSKIELGTEYILYLDAMGVAYAAVEGESNKNLGVVLSMYKENAYDELPTVSILTADGEVVKYPVKDKAAALAIDEAVTDVYVNTDDTDMVVEPMSDYNYDTAEARAYVLSNRVIEYIVTPSGALRFKNDINVAGTIGTYANGAEYNKSTSKLDSYRVTDEDTKMLDLSAFVQNPTQAGYRVISVSDLQDEANYYAYVYDKKTSSPEYRFALIMAGTTSLTPKSEMAVVTMAGELVRTPEGDDVQVLKVMTADSEEPIEVLYEGTAINGVDKITEGTVIMYSVGSEGYVEKGKLYKVFVPAANYKAMMGGIVAATTPFVELQNGAATVSYAGDQMTVGDKENTDVKVYFGPVYSAQPGIIEMFVSKVDTISNVGTLKTFTPDSETNEYTFSCDWAVGEGLAVKKGASYQSASVYKGLYVTYDGVEDDSTIDWTTVGTAVNASDAAPMTAFVREYKNDVTDIVYFVAN